jgi:hypothetical protein
MPDPNRQARGRLGGLTSWANTPNRSARTAPAVRANPSSIEWHLARLDAERFADATDQQKLEAAEAARRAYFARMAYKSAKARRRVPSGDAA